MIIKKIAKLCRERKDLVSLNHNGEMWVGTTYGALYLLDTLPEMSADQIMTMFDYSEKVKRGMNCLDGEIYKQLIEYQDSNDAQISDYQKTVIDDTDVIVFRKPNNGIIICDSHIFEPFADSEKDTGLYYFLREDPSGFEYIAVKAGLQLIGIVMPTLFRVETLTEWLASTQQLLLDIEDMVTRAEAEAEGSPRTDEEKNQLKLT